MKEVDDFNRRFREGDAVEVLWNRETGFTTRQTLTSHAFVWHTGDAVAHIGGVGYVLCAAIHMPAGVGG